MEVGEIIHTGENCETAKCIQNPGDCPELLVEEELCPEFDEMDCVAPVRETRGTRVFYR